MASESPRQQKLGADAFAQHNLPSSAHRRAHPGTRTRTAHRGHSDAAVEPRRRPSWHDFLMCFWKNSRNLSCGVKRFAESTQPWMVHGTAAGDYAIPRNSTPALPVILETFAARRDLMKNKVSNFLLVFVLTISATAQTTAHFDGKTWWDHVKVLADDNMEGRETGSRGLRKAEAYVVGQLKSAALQPAGTKGFYQPVKFVSREIDESKSSAALIHDGKAQPLTLGDDAIFGTRVDLAPHVEASLVFVGYGLSIPEKNYDDLAGLDLNGKVAVLLSGSPADIPGALSAHSQSAAVRWKALRNAGAIGVIGIPNPASMDIPWSRIAVNRTHPSMALADPKFNETEGEQLSLTFNPAKAEALFVGSGHTFQEIADLGKDRKPLPRFPLAVSIRTTAKLKRKTMSNRPTSSPN